MENIHFKKIVNRDSGNCGTIREEKIFVSLESQTERKKRAQLKNMIKK